MTTGIQGDQLRLRLLILEYSTAKELLTSLPLVSKAWKEAVYSDETWRCLIEREGHISKSQRGPLRGKEIYQEVVTRTRYAYFVEKYDKEKGLFQYDFIKKTLRMVWMLDAEYSLRQLEDSSLFLSRLAFKQKRGQLSVPRLTCKIFNPSTSTEAPFPSIRSRYDVYAIAEVTRYVYVFSLGETEVQIDRYNLSHHTVKNVGEISTKEVSWALPHQDVIFLGYEGAIHEYNPRTRALRRLFPSVTMDLNFLPSCCWSSSHTILVFGYENDTDTDCCGWTVDTDSKTTEKLEGVRGRVDACWTFCGKCYVASIEDGFYIYEYDMKEMNAVAEFEL